MAAAMAIAVTAPVPVAAQPTGKVAPISAERARAGFRDALASARRALVLPVKAPTFDDRLAAYRASIEILFTSYVRVHRDPALARERADIGRIVDEALSTLPATDPARPLLEGLREAGAVSAERMRMASESAPSPARTQAAAQVVAGIVVSVVAIVASNFADGRSLTVAQASAPIRGTTPLDPAVVQEWRRSRDAALASALASAHKASESARAEGRLRSATVSLRRLIGDLESALAR